MTIDLGLTHIALPVANIEHSIEFYTTYANMQVIHRRIDAETGVAVVWLSDRTRPFAIKNAGYSRQNVNTFGGEGDSVVVTSPTAESS